MQTYLKTAALGLDDWVAALLLNRNDLCLSAACGLYRRGPGCIAPLGLGPRRLAILRVIGNALERFWPGHCEAAIVGDIDRAKRAHALLAHTGPLLQCTLCHAYVAKLGDLHLCTGGSYKIAMSAKRVERVPAAL